MAPRPLLSRKRRQEPPPETSTPAAPETPTVAAEPEKKAGLSCDLGGNFDYSSIDADLSEGDSDDMDIQFY